MPRLSQRRFGQLATVTLLALVAQSLSASGQGAATQAAAGPSFQSGGLKVTVASISAQAGNVSLSLLIENKTQENLLVSVIGPPLGTNGGNVLEPAAIGGISYCIYNPQNIQRHQLEHSFEINGCLKGAKPQLSLDTFTLIDAGNAVPMNVGFAGFNPVDREKDFSFSMNVAVFKESDANSAADSDTLGGKSKEQKLPRSLRYISVGIPSLPLIQK
jgi:hypothetical protein